MQGSQIHREVGIGTPLGDDVLLVHTFSGTEELGRLFEYNVTLSADKHDISFDSLVGQNVTLRVGGGAAEGRIVNGFISRFAMTGGRHRRVQYEATIVPWLFFLTRSADCRIFQEKKVPEIIKLIAEEHGFTDIEDRLSETYRTWTYCVQYRETAFNFISRLMEQEGIYYYFKHENGKHTMVLADGASSHDPIPGSGVPFATAEVDDAAQIFTEWQLMAQVMSGVVAQRDFDFTAPKSNLETKSVIQRQHGGAQFEVFDYPGDYLDTAEGDKSCQVRIEELQAPQEIVHGKTNVREVNAGVTFKLTGHPREDQAREYLATSTTISGVVEEYESGQSSGGLVYECSVQAIDSRRTFRSASLTRKPMVSGPQTAFVVGKSGEEIWTDKYGRVKVQFHWDRRSNADEQSSCWVRTAQTWAGKKWGAVFIPRIGSEVVVQFLEGDPDRPLITGLVYNGDCMPPHTLPEKATVSTIKTNSSKGGGKANELRFEDKSGSEMVYVHATKDHDVRVEEKERHFIGTSQHVLIKEDQKVKVEGDRHDHVLGDSNEKVDGNISREAGQNLQEKSGQKYAMDAGTEIHLKAGMKVVIEAGTQLSLKVGGTFVNLSPSGVDISGPMVNINSGGAAGSGGGSSPTAPADPEEVPEEEAGEVPTVQAQTPPKPAKWGSQAKVLKKAAATMAPFCEECEKARTAEEENRKRAESDRQWREEHPEDGAKGESGGKAAVDGGSTIDGEAKAAKQAQGPAGGPAAEPRSDDSHKQAKPSPNAPGEGGDGGVKGLGATGSM